MAKRIIIPLFLIALLLTGCSTSRNALRNTVIGGLSGTEYMEKVIEWTPQRENLTARTRVQLNMGSESSSVSVNANMRIRRGELIRLSVAPVLGIEVARMDITPKGVLVIDRMNRRYVEIGFAEVADIMKVEVDFNALQSLFLNEIFLPGRESLTVEDAVKFDLSEQDGRAHLQVKDSRSQMKDSRSQAKAARRMNYSFFTSAMDGRLEETVISLKDLPYALHCRYTDFTMVGSDVFPQSIELTPEGTQKKYSLGLKLSRIGTDSGWDAKSEVPAKYRKMTVQEVIQLIIKN
ncbi:DUF4292 domain-containing protein [uncultured Bacteroides sp.]|uniref:DUF4292 domain-containing protein n=1 Tax=uncultured Bacteroides sp. TaxID=162156 RepID=UPI0025EF46F6|nr:DUF4292 domain-containing protein [uncultured Bacteroides sp.]